MPDKEKTFGNNTSFRCSDEPYLFEKQIRELDILECCVINYWKKLQIPFYSTVHIPHSKSAGYPRKCA